MMLDQDLCLECGIDLWHTFKILMAKFYTGMSFGELVEKKRKERKESVQ